MTRASRLMEITYASVGSQHKRRRRRSTRHSKPTVQINEVERRAPHLASKHSDDKGAQSLRCARKARADVCSKMIDDQEVKRSSARHSLLEPSILFSSPRPPLRPPLGRRVELDPWIFAHSVEHVGSTALSPCIINKARSGPVPW